MKSVQIVAPGHILGVWETVWPMLNIAFINYEHIDYDIEQLKVLLIKEFQILFVVIEDKEGNIEDNILGFDMSHPIIQFFIYNNMYIDRLDRSLVLKKD